MPSPLPRHWVLGSRPPSALKLPLAQVSALLARLGQAEALIASKEFDRGLKIMEDLAANRDGLLPVDGVLMQLARGYQKAGKPAEARTAFKRIVDEFPDSLFVPQARTELAKLG